MYIYIKLYIHIFIGKQTSFSNFNFQNRYSKILNPILEYLEHISKFILFLSLLIYVKTVSLNLIQRKFQM